MNLVPKSCCSPDPAWQQRPEERSDVKPPFTVLQRAPLSPLQSLQPPPAPAQGLLCLPLGAAFPQLPGQLLTPLTPWVLPGVSVGFREAASPCAWDCSVEFHFQLCLRTSLGPGLGHHHGRVALATAWAAASRAPSMVFLGAGHPHQGSERPLAQGPTSPLASRLLLLPIRSRAAPFQMLLLRARSDPFPARDSGCATPLEAKENPFLASASCSGILERVSE